MSWIPSYKKPQSAPEPPTIVQWSTGTDEEIVAMVEAHYQGVIDLHDYWAVGDERTVHLPAMSALSPLTDTHAEQDVVFVLSHVGGKTLVDGVTECAFQVDQKDSLLESGLINSTADNTGGWRDCSRRTWCNSTYYNAIPSTLRPIFKQHINYSGQGNFSTSGVYSSNDYFALRAEVEVLGNSSNYSVSGEGTQATWYGTSANRKKKGKTISIGYQAYYTRSPQARQGSGYDCLYKFCTITASGGAATTNANGGSFIAPFGVI